MSTRLLAKGSPPNHDFFGQAGTDRDEEQPAGRVAEVQRGEWAAMIGGWCDGRDAGSDDALIRKVYEQHGQAVLTYAIKRTRDRAAAEDVLQETLVRAWRHSTVLVNGRGSVRAWLFTVAERIIVDRGRARSARPREVFGFSVWDRKERDFADQLIDSIQVFEALRKLSKDHREVVVQVFFHQRSVREIAVALGVPEGTVKSRVHRAIQALRELLDTTREDS